MVRLSLEQLEQKKMRLLRRDNARKSLLNLSMVRSLKRKKLKAEIKALENPGSVSVRRVARNIGIRSAKILFKGGVALGKHLSEVAAEQNRPVRKRHKTKTRKRR